MTRFRRILQDNPFRSYASWVESKRTDKPAFITLKDSKENPEILTDVLGVRYVVLSASRTENGVVLPMGVREDTYFDKAIRLSKKYIITPEIEVLLSKEYTDIPEYTDAFFFSCTIYYILREELGYLSNKDKKAWLSQHIDELLELTVYDFYLKHIETGLRRSMISKIKTAVRHILKGMKKRPRNPLMKALIEHWKHPNNKSIEKIDLITGYESSDIRRAFAILKAAKKI